MFIVQNSTLQNKKQSIPSVVHYLQSDFEQQNMSLNLPRADVANTTSVQSVSVRKLLNWQHFNPERVSLPPAVVSVGSVGFGHLVQLVLLLDNVALLTRRRQQLLAKFFIHVCASVFVVPALCDHPFHGEEAPSVLRKRDGHLSGVED